MRYDKSETLELGKAEDVIQVWVLIGSIEENPFKLDKTMSHPAAYLSEYDDEE